MHFIFYDGSYEWEKFLEVEEKLTFKTFIKFSGKFLGF